MSDSTSTQYGRSVGVDLATSLASAGRLIFTTEDAEAHAPPGVSRGQVHYLLKLLTDAGWLIRLRRGLYAGTGRLPGGVDVPPFAVATALVEPSAIGLWSALAYHDLTDQAPIVVTAITPRKVVTPSMRSGEGDVQRRHVWRVAGVECLYVTLRADRYDIGLEEVWLDERFSVDITDRERTVLDTFALARHFGGLGEGLAVVNRALPGLDVPKLASYALRYGSSALVKRLGWSLERAGVDASTLRPLLEAPASSYSPLDPGRPRRGEHDRRWRLIVNLAS